MMEKKKKTLKKIIAILCVFVVLQSYFSCFAQIAIAVSETVVGGETEPYNPDEVAVRWRRRKQPK